MTASPLLSQRLSWALAALPASALALFAIYVGAVTFEYGALPQYARPDPKQTDASNWLHTPVLLLIVVAFASPLLRAIFLFIARIQNAPLRHQLYPSLVQLIGWTALFAAFRFDLFGLPNWLMD